MNSETELGMELGPKIGQVITQNVVPRMAKNIVPTLQQTIPEKVNKVVPYLMERALPIKLNKLLTLTVTHALVPTLTTALTRTPDQEVWCHLCYYKHIHCNYCHDSAQSEYYNNYYSAYYADYYSRYFFKTAAFEVDKATEDADTQFKFELERLADDICQHDNCNKLGKDYPLPPN